MPRSASFEFSNPRRRTANLLSASSSQPSDGDEKDGGGKADVSYSFVGEDDSGKEVGGCGCGGET